MKRSSAFRSLYRGELFIAPTHLEELVDLLQVLLSGQAVESVGDQTIQDTNREEAVLVWVSGYS